MREVAIIGVGMHPWGKFDNKSLNLMCREAVDAAIEDAGVEWRDIQAIASGSSRFSGGFGWGLNGNEIGIDIGMTGVPIYNLSAGCAAGGHAFNVAYMLVAMGQADIVLAVAGEKMPRGFLPLSGNEADPLDVQYLQFACAGMTGPSFWAMLTRRRMEIYGTTEEDLARIVVKAHKNSVDHPYARYRRKFSMEEVMNSPMVCYPLRLYEICPLSDGAAAVVLCSADKARQRTTRPVWVASSVIATSSFGDGTPKGVSAVAAPEHAEHSEVTQAVKKAFAAAGMGPEDLSFLELQDNTPYYELCFPEEWGIVEPGRMESLHAAGETTPVGKLPINPSGGFQSFGEATTAQGLFQICEVTWQLRGEATGRQVPNAKTGLAQVIGLGGNAAATILKV